MNMDEANMMDDMRDEIADLKAQIEKLESDLEMAKERINEVIGNATDIVEDAYREGFNDARPAETEDDAWIRSLSRSSLSGLR